MTAVAKKAGYQVTTKIQQIGYVADEFIRMAETSLEKFAANFSKDPHYAFSWGNDAVTAAARKHVGIMLQEYLVKVRENQPTWSDDEVAACIVSELRDEMLRKARWPEHSTSAISNMISQARTAAVAEFVARMDGKQ